MHDRLPSRSHAAQSTETPGPLAVLEIVSDDDGKAPVDLIRSIYRASDRGLIVLALNGVDPADVDHALDELVPQMPLDIPGLVYVDINDSRSILSAVRTANLVFAVSRGFRRWAEVLGFQRCREETPGCSHITLLRPLTPSTSAFRFPVIDALDLSAMLIVPAR